MSIQERAIRIEQLKGEKDAECVRIQLEIWQMLKPKIQHNTTEITRLTNENIQLERAVTELQNKLKRVVDHYDLIIKAQIALNENKPTKEGQ